MRSLEGQLELCYLDWMLKCLFGEGHIARFLVLTCLLFCAVQSQAIADEHPVVISGGRIPHVFDPDQPGPYNIIVEKLRANLARPVEVEFFPISHAMRQLAHDKYDCFAMALKHSPNWERLGLDRNQFVFIGPVAWLRINVYVRPGENLPDVLNARATVAADGTIAVLKDAFEGQWSSVDYVPAGSFVQALQMLVDGEVDAALSYDVDVDALADDHPLKGKFVDAGVTIAEMEDGLMCKSSDEMLPIILGLQENLDKLVSDGSLEEILKQQ